MNVLKDILVMFISIIVALLVFVALGIGFSALMHFIGVGSAFALVGTFIFVVVTTIFVREYFGQKSIDKPKI